jgi:hypothetical protein
VRHQQEHESWLFLNAPSLMIVTKLKNTPNAVDNPSIIDIAGDGAMLAIITDDASTDHSTR